MQILYCIKIIIVVLLTRNLQYLPIMFRAKPKPFGSQNLRNWAKLVSPTIRKSKPPKPPKPQ